MSVSLRLLRDIPLAILSPVFAAVSLLLLWLTDLCWWAFGACRASGLTAPPRNAASVVIPNWNGRDLLEKYVPSVIDALEGNPENELIIVDNGSTDGSAAFIRAKFPGVRLIELPQNLGFGGGSNRGFREARNDIVVLLNSDMRVAKDFLAPLLGGFSDPAVFSVACQIFISDPAKVREETGLTQTQWSGGALRVRHRIDDDIQESYPCAYGGGGSCAFDRRKFEELGGFDPLLSPFYLEDTDIGYLAWKRGWKVLYQPKSHVWHEHRGTIGKRYSQGYIAGVLKKNFLLFAWKNIHSPRWLLAHFGYTCIGALLSLIGGDSPERANVAGMARAFFQLPGAMASRWRARSLGQISDEEAFRRPLAGWYRDRFGATPDPAGPLHVLLVAPYPICPPIHGGAVFMNETIRQLGRLASLHLITLLERAEQEQSHTALQPFCASMRFLLRPSGRQREKGSLLPYAVKEFAFGELEWLIHKQIYFSQADVLQLEYTQMAQYGLGFERIAVALFEHDVYFQSIGRGLGSLEGMMTKIRAVFEYLRTLRFELRSLAALDLVQTCTPQNSRYLLSFEPSLAGKVDDDLRAGIDTSRYTFRGDGREPNTLLFLGSFRHAPNVDALKWFVTNVLPSVAERVPRIRLIIAGSDPPPAHTLPKGPGAVEMLGFVEDVREPLSRYALFVCPILAGSGVRVKLLEAFAAGIPVVSTRLGAEGLAGVDGERCALADDPGKFADKIVELINDPEGAAAMAERARDYVAGRHDIQKMTERLVASYRRALRAKNGSAGEAPYLAGGGNMVS
jgi:O-antigen biosynthesis protein